MTSGLADGGRPCFPPSHAIDRKCPRPILAAAVTPRGCGHLLHAGLAVAKAVSSAPRGLRARHLDQHHGVVLALVAADGRHVADSNLVGDHRRSLGLGIARRGGRGRLLQSAEFEHDVVVRCLVLARGVAVLDRRHRVIAVNVQLPLILALAADRRVVQGLVVGPVSGDVDVEVGVLVVGVQADGQELALARIQFLQHVISTLDAIGDGVPVDPI